MPACVGCHEDWPRGREFYRVGNDVCLACEAEGYRKPAKPKARGYRTPEQVREHQRAKYLRHRDSYLARMREYYAANAAAINQRRRALRAKGQVTEWLG
jgi:hypothetical protein